MKISQLEAFVAIVELGSLSAAALELELSQSTLSHSIAKLEEELGIVLLVRGRHGAMLTSEGEQVLPEARQVLQLLESMRQKARLAKDLQEGLVRVASVRSVATHVLPDVIAQFRDRFPGMAVMLTEYDFYAEVEQALRDGQVDIGLTFLPTSSEFQTWELLRDEFVALLPVTHNLPIHHSSSNPSSDDHSRDHHSLDHHSFQPAIDWNTIISYPMIMNYRSYHHNKVVQDHLQKLGYTLRVTYEIREDSTVIGMVKRGLGATIMARLAAEPIPPEVAVYSLPDPLERVIGAAVLADGLLPRSVFAFLDILQAWVAKS